MLDVNRFGENYLRYIFLLDQRHLRDLLQYGNMIQLMPHADMELRHPKIL
jgi:hypothetical protein